MSGGPQFEYKWQDDTNYKTPTKLTAPNYINQLIFWVEDQVNVSESLVNMVTGYTETIILTF